MVKAKTYWPPRADVAKKADMLGNTTLKISFPIIHMLIYVLELFLLLHTIIVTSESSILFILLSFEYKLI